MKVLLNTRELYCGIKSVCCNDFIVTFTPPFNFKGCLKHVVRQLCIIFATLPKQLKSGPPTRDVRVGWGKEISVKKWVQGAN